ASRPTASGLCTRAIRPAIRISTCKASGQNAINLTKDSPDDDTQPAFSPDGESIAFRSERQGGGIFVMGRTGESVTRVTDGGYTPAWSPDGTQLVFATAAPNVFGMVPSEIWIVTLASGERNRLSDVDGIQASWSPHGHRIAYWAVLAKGHEMIHHGGRGGHGRANCDQDWTSASSASSVVAL